MDNIDDAWIRYAGKREWEDMRDRPGVHMNETGKMHNKSDPIDKILR